MAEYSYLTRTQYGNCLGNPLYKATKRYLNNRWTVKNLDNVLIYYFLYFRYCSGRSDISPSSLLLIVVCFSPRIQSQTEKQLGIFSLMFMFWYISLSLERRHTLVESMYLVFTRMPGRRYRKRLMSLLLCFCDGFVARINSLFCWVYTGASFKCYLMSSDVSWHTKDKLRPMREHGSILLYVHGNYEAR